MALKNIIKNVSIKNMISNVYYSRILHLFKKFSKCTFRGSQLVASLHVITIINTDTERACTILRG